MNVGDTVITMGAPGRFKIIAVDGDAVTIENDDGLRKTVRNVNLRVLPEPAVS